MPFKRISRDYQLMYSDNLMEKVTHISTNNRRINMEFYTPNSLCLYRAETFSNKEPETLAWIEEFGCNNATLIDIGANVGLYSIYHNKVNNGRCIAFEPSFFNLKLLAKNINVNNCQHLTTVFTNPLSSKTGLSDFKYGSVVEGGALSAFGVDFGYNGEKIQNNMQLNVLGMSLDWMTESQIIDTTPNLVKIDVDGIEHIILQGAKKILTHADCKSVLVEVNDAFKEQADKVAILLESYGFALRDKLQGDSASKSNLFSDTFNQIWVKKNNL
jgi:FkbM family methyltransferase